MKTTTTNLQIRDLSPVRCLIAGAFLLLSLSASSALAQTVKPPALAADSQKEDILKLEKYEVTGSRIKRLDSEAVSPVVQLSTSDLAAKGFPTFADALHTLSFNNGSAIKPIDSGNSFTPGVDAFNMRGMGVNSTLTLLNGRRTATYAVPGYDGKQSMVDLNSIPDAAIEAVEILKDGGSAIYGSDAVAGVLNIKLRKDYQGLQTTLGYGDYFNTSGATKYASFVEGLISGKLSIMTVGSWRDTDGIMSRDLYYTRDADFNNLVPKTGARYLITGNADLKTALATGFSDPYTAPAADAYNYGYYDYRSTRGFPGYVTINGTKYTYNEPTAAPALGAAVEGSNLYNFQKDTTFTDSRRTYSFFTRASYDFSQYLKANVELSYVHNETYSASAPAPADLINEQGLTPGSKMYIPKENPYNPWGVDIYDGSRRLVEANVRGNSVSSNTPRLFVSFEGALPETGFFKGWTWDVGFLYSQSEVADSSPGTIPDARLQQALLGLISDGQGGLRYDPAAPVANRTYFNWFGYNDEALTKYLVIENPTTALSRLVSYDFHVGGPVAHLPAGDISLLIGGEHHYESLALHMSELNNTGGIIGGSWKSGWGGTRTIDAIYAEMAIPVFKWLELQAAGRFENYSDKDFEERVRPKFGVKLRPLNWLVLRASYSESYTAPDLAYLYQAMSVSFTGGQVTDPITKEKLQVEMHAVGDPNLKPQTTKTYYAGIALEPQRGALKGFYAGLDFYRFERDNLLDTATSLISSWADFFNKADKGIEPYKDMVVRDPNTNRIMYVNLPFLNIANAHWAGFDFELAYKWRTEKWGDFRAALNGTYNITDKYNSEQMLGTYGQPSNRRLLCDIGLYWKRRDWGANVTCNYIRGTDVASMIDMSDDSNVGDLYLKYRVKDQYVFNTQVYYTGLWNMRISLGVTNVFNQCPPVYLDGSPGPYTDPNWVLPASWFLKVTKDF